MSTAEAEQTRICALVVSYQPDLPLLRKVIEQAAAQVSQVLLVDNASDPALPLQALSAANGLACLQLEHNMGLAAAQNRGLEWIQEQGYSHVLLLDQDSLVQAGMVAALLQALLELERSGSRPAAVGPVYLDPRTQGSRPFVRFGRLGLKRYNCADRHAPLETDFLIASGSLIPLRIIHAVGAFEAPLFIDNIDLEWSFRVRAQGYRLFGICGAEMLHHLGDAAVRIWLGRWWQVYRHSPLRQYYMARNRVVLYRRSYSPTGWIVQDLLRFIVKLVLFGLVFAPRLKNLQMIFRGLRDGLTERLGPYRG